LTQDPCEVAIYGASDFALLRTRAASPNHWGPSDLTDDIAESVQSGPVVPFSPGAGKSGSSFARTWDGHFKIKVGIRASSLMDEPSNLLRLVKGWSGHKRAVPLHQHLVDHRDSLLNRYYGLFRIKLGDLEPFGLVMLDATYGMDARVTDEMKQDPSLTLTRYDLKGKSRDLNRKQSPNSQFTLINGDFKEREGNELKMRNRQCDKLRATMLADTGYLAAHNMIDYSVFVMVAKAPPYRYAPSCSGTPREPFCFEAGSRTYTVSNIDYLNDFNAAKQIESLTGKFSDYNGKIMDFIKEVCPNDKKEWWTAAEMGMFFLVSGVLITCFGVLMRWICKQLHPGQARARSAHCQASSLEMRSFGDRQVGQAVNATQAPSPSHQYCSPSSQGPYSASSWGANPSHQGAYDRAAFPDNFAQAAGQAGSPRTPSSQPHMPGSLAGTPGSWTPMSGSIGTPHSQPQPHVPGSPGGMPGSWALMPGSSAGMLGSQDGVPTSQCGIPNGQADGLASRVGPHQGGTPWTAYGNDFGIGS